jgi:hypothetical protein
VTVVANGNVLPDYTILDFSAVSNGAVPSDNTFFNRSLKVTFSYLISVLVMRLDFVAGASESS